MPGLSADEVRKVANLANLKITDEELEDMTAALSDVLGHIAMLERLDTEEVPPTSHALEMENVFRKDAVKERFRKGKTLDNAPAKEHGYFSVPRIIE
jgi:aspartyl-tRNA(Asn)/glutamyl-tRNA(Gln) amidotransferase subunit C